jgi:ATP-dependent helicase Lhr and Lhr-like helicase
MNSRGTEVAAAALARMMPDAWPVFFQRRCPWPAQVLLMPRVVKGESVLLAAPTASGKTEAAMAPLFQRHLSFRRDRLSTVYVAPTKALVNDLRARLDDYLGIRFPHAVQRYTGDHHDFRTPEDAFCLVVTPEALDSLQLTRPQDLACVRAVVIDEIHLLHASARGQQLRYVIDRIRQAAVTPKSKRDTFQVVGMTATIHEMDEVRAVWLGADSTAVSHGTPRDIEFVFVDVPPPQRGELPRERATAVRRWLDQTGVAKVLVCSPIPGMAPTRLLRLCRRRCQGRAGRCTRTSVSSPQPSVNESRRPCAPNDAGCASPHRRLRPESTSAM